MIRTARFSALLSRALPAGLALLLGFCVAQPGQPTGFSSGVVLGMGILLALFTGLAKTSSA